MEAKETREEAETYLQATVFLLVADRPWKLIIFKVLYYDSNGKFNLFGGN